MDTSAWRQLTVRFPAADTVETDSRSYLAPALAEIEETGLIDRWFFLRKSEVVEGARLPCWRVRLHPRDDSTGPEAIAQLRKRLEPAFACTEVIYEPEVHAFGGQEGMAVAHTLFHHDSHHLLTHLQQLAARDNGLGRIEWAVLAYSHLFHAAGQDWFEQGDIWATIADHWRPADALPPERVESWRPSVRRLMTVDTTPLTRTGAALDFAADWLDAITTVGRDLGDLARTGILQRGLRNVLAHHVLFGLNRLGLDATAQALIAHTARTLVFDSPKEA